MVTPHEPRQRVGEPLKEGNMKDLSNARIIEWEEGGEAFVGARTSRRYGFQTVSAEPGGSANYAGFLTELEAENVGARVVAEFPRPSLAEVVGDAPAFRATYQAREECLVVQLAGGAWLGLSLEAAGVRRLFSVARLSRVEGDIDPASVVVLRPTKDDER